MIFLLLGCTEYNTIIRTNKDTFQQNRLNTVDVLLVVDNSCSMVEEQGKLATNFLSFIQYFESADVNWQIGTVTTDTVDQDKFSGKLLGGDDEIILSGPTGALVDRVAYDWDWNVPTGASMALDPNKATSTYNDASTMWCAGGSDSDAGTPGAANPSCKGEEVDPDPTPDTGLATETPQAGEVIVNEFMADPTGKDDNLGEWVELKNISDHPIDLGGSTLSDTGQNRFTIPEGTILEPYEYIVFARAEGMVEGAIVMGDTFTLNNRVRIINRDTEGADEIFSEQVSQGTGGSGIEMGLEAARLAFEPQNAETNVGLLREEANLSLIIVSDEEDSSPYSVNDYYRYFADLKGDAAYRDHQLFNLSGVVGKDEPQFSDQPSCSSDDGVADFGSRYVDLAERTGGLLESICDEDFSPIAAELGLVLSGLAVEFELSALPREDTLEVDLYASNSADSFVKTLVKDEDYIYVPERNAIRFEEDKVPAPESYLEVSYELQSGGGE